MIVFKTLLRRYTINNFNSRNKQILRYSSILKTIDSSPVLVSSNHDVYTNLALEHWLYNNLRFNNNDKTNLGDYSKVYNNPVVFIWTDEPCVVIGRHQNPWVESRMGFIHKANLKLARRHSGGGCVYHDENNINISIIGNRKLFENRQNNLKFLAKVLFDNYGIKCEPTRRHDLIHSESGLKLSGSAAKLGKHNCYHHFTLLVDTNKDALYTSIRENQQDFIKTNSSLSTRSKVINLKEIKSDLDVNQVICDLANAYNELYLDSKSKRPARKDSVTGDENDYQSLNEFKEELVTWDWLYGKTPKFILEKIFPIIDGGIEKQVKFVVQINKGLFERIDIDCDLLGLSPGEKFQYLLGTKFTYHHAMVNIAKLLQIDESSMVASNMTIGFEQLFATFLLQMVHESNY